MRASLLLTTLFTTLLPTLTLAEDFTPYSPFLNALASLDKRQSSQNCAAAGYVPCGTGCKPAANVCCVNKGYCELNEYCDGVGCCPNGKKCSGGVLTHVSYFDTTSTASGGGGGGASSTRASSAASTPAATSGSGSSSSSSSGSGCLATENECGTGCLPLGYTCCPDKQGGCRTASETCVQRSSGSYGCCDIGKTCFGASGGSSGGSSGSLSSTRAATSSSSSTSTSTSSSTTRSSTTTASGSGGSGAPGSAAGVVAQGVAGNILTVGAMPALAAGGFALAQAIL